MNTTILGGIIVLLIIIVGVGYFATQNTNPEMNQDSQMDEGAVTVSGQEESMEEMMVGEGNVSEDTLQEAQAGVYLAYDPEAVATSDADTVVLFFHADWCPTCRALDQDITNNLSNIPAGMEIYKVNYDQETALRQQYGVVRQHSIVSIDANGEAVGSIFHPNSLSQLISGV